MNTKFQFSYIFPFSFFFIIAFCLFIPQQIRSQKTEWIFVESNMSNTSRMFVGKNIVKLKNGIIQVWQKEIVENSKITIGLVEWNCSKKQLRVIRENIYNIFGELIERHDLSSDWDYVTPDTVGDSIYNVVCKNRKTSNKSATKISLAEIITTAASLRESPNIRGNVIREVSLGEQLILSDEESVGNWYKVIDKESQTEGWLHKTTFKIIKPNQTKAKTNKKNKKQIRQNR
jgi:hypothetical protein